MGVLRDVRERLRDDVERGRLDRLGQPLRRHGVELDRERRARGERLERRREPAVGEHGRVDPAGELAQLLEREGELGARALRISEAPSGSPSSFAWASRRASESETSRCCAPSWRFRSSRRRSAACTSTMRARDRRSSSCWRFCSVTSTPQTRYERRPLSSPSGRIDQATEIRRPSRATQTPSRSTTWPETIASAIAVCAVGSSGAIELEQRPPDRVVAPAERLLEAGVDAVRPDAAVRLDHGEQVRRRAADRAQERVALAQLLLLPLALGHVDAVDQPAVLAVLVDSGVHDHSISSRSPDDARQRCSKTPGAAALERALHGLRVLGRGEQLPEEPAARLVVVGAAGQLLAGRVEADDAALGRDDAEDARRGVDDGREEVALPHDLLLGLPAVGDVADDREHLVLAAPTNRASR